MSQQDLASIIRKLRLGLGLYQSEIDALEEATKRPTTDDAYDAW